MSVLTGAGLLCYAANLYLLPPPGRRGWSRPPLAHPTRYGQLTHAGPRPA